MSDDKNWRFFAANVAAAALLVNGIGFLANRSSQKEAASAEAEADAEGESKCPCKLPEHTFSHMCGVAAVSSAVCLQDRLPYAGAAGADLLSGAAGLRVVFLQALSRQSCLTCLDTMKRGKLPAPSLPRSHSLLVVSITPPC